MRLREWLERGEAQLSAGQHAARARRDAETLLLHAIGKNRAWLLAHFDDEFAGCAAIGYAGVLERRLKGEPIQYITGECEFYGLPFRVTRDVLIPRPETEHLVERAIAITGGSPGSRIVDVGTGSGAIAVALASRLSKALVTATDISGAALDLARENAARNGTVERIRFLQGDLLQPVAGEIFDLIVSNPPYVASADRNSLSVEVREYEPSLALFAGDNGLSVYCRLIPAAYDGLASGGFLLLEIGFGQTDAVREILTQAGFTHIEFTHDLQGIPRVASAQRP